MSLVAHLRREPRLARAPGQLTRLRDRPRQRLLDVHVLSEIHGGERDRRVHVIRRGDDDRVDAFFFVEHLAIVLVSLRTWHVLVGEACHRVNLRPCPLLFERAHHGNRAAGSGAAECLLVRQPRAQALRICREAIERLAPVIPVHVAHRDDVLRRDVDHVGAALAADADARDVQPVARGLEAFAEHVTRDDSEAGASQPDIGDERPSRELRHHCTSRILMLRKPSDPA